MPQGPRQRQAYRRRAADQCTTSSTNDCAFFDRSAEPHACRSLAYYLATQILTRICPNSSRYEVEASRTRIPAPKAPHPAPAILKCYLVVLPNDKAYFL